MSLISSFGIIAMCLTVLPSLFISVSLVLIVKLLGIQLYLITSQDNTKLIRKKLSEYPSSLMINDQTSGLILSRNFIAYVTEENGIRGPNVNIHLFTTKAFYESIKSLTNEDNYEDQEKTKKDKKLISILERSTHVFNNTYRTVKVNYSHIDERPHQAEVIDKIIAKYQSSLTHKCVVFIEGTPGTGKSMIANLLAKRLDSPFTSEFNPTDAGDSLRSVIQEAMPSKKKPVIIRLDEIDIIFRKVIENKVEKHKHIHTMVTDKISLNAFFDNFDQGRYQNIIVIMTSNLTCQQIDDMDPSFMRDGRVDLKIKLD